MHPLQVAGFDFRFRAPTRMRMPGYMGSAWRGGFGRALRRAVCVTGLPACPGCPFEASCIYPYLFETAPGGHPPLPTLPSPASGEGQGGGCFGLALAPETVAIAAQACAHGALTRPAVNSRP